MVRRLVTDHIQFRSKNMDTHQDYISMYYVRYHILFVSMTPVGEFPMMIVLKTIQTKILK